MITGTARSSIIMTYLHITFVILGESGIGIPDPGWSQLDGDCAQEALTPNSLPLVMAEEHSRISNSRTVQVKRLEILSLETPSSSW